MEWGGNTGGARREWETWLSEGAGGGVLGGEEDDVVVVGDEFCDEGVGGFELEGQVFSLMMESAAAQRARRPSGGWRVWSHAW